MKKFRHLFILLLFLVLCMSLPLGFSSFSLGETEITEVIPDNNVTLKNVAFNSVTKKQYTTVEMALKEANSGDTVYLFPANVANTTNEVTINENCEIKSGVTLNLPYSYEVSGDTYTFEWNLREGTNTTANKFADCDATAVKTNRKLLLKIKQGVTLTITGTLQIGGILGTKTQELQGYTSGSYAEILLETGEGTNNLGARIVAENGSKIECQGYIKETSKTSSLINSTQLILNEGALLYLPFVVYDYQGGSATGAIYTEGFSAGIGDLGSDYIDVPAKNCPFNLFDCPNIQCLTYVYSGSKVEGYVSLYTGEVNIIITLPASRNTATATLISNENSVINLTSGYLSFKYEHDNVLYTTPNYNKAKTYIKVYGTCSNGALVMDLNVQISKLKVDTSSIYFPISYRFDISVMNGGILNLEHSIKFMNGFNLTINKGGIVNVAENSNVIFYTQNWTDTKTTVPYVPNYNNSWQVTSKTVTVGSSNVGEAKLSNNGTLNIYTSNFAGSVESTIADAKLFIKNAINNVSTKECNGTGGRDGLSYKFHITYSVNISETNKITQFNKLMYSEGNLLPGTYYSKLSSDGNYRFGQGPANINILGKDEIEVGVSEYYSVEYNDYLYADRVQWYGDEELIINNNESLNCSITSNSIGTFNIFVNFLSGDTIIFTANKKIIVKEMSNLGITIPNQNYYLDIGDFTSIEIEIRAEGIENYSVSWSSENNDIASVDNLGVVTGISYGSTKIIAIISDNNGNNARAETTITVSNVVKVKDFNVHDGSTLLISRDSDSGEESQTCQINPTPSNATGNRTVVSNNANKVSATISGNVLTAVSRTNEDIEIKLTISTTNGVNNTTISRTLNVQVKKHDEGCVAEDTLITLSDGTQKLVQDLKQGDLVKVFNHEEGIYDVSPILFVAHEEEPKSLNTILRLKFNDGSILDIINEHTLFDSSINEFAIININTVNNFIGDTFPSITFNCNNVIRKDVKLLDYEIFEKETKIYQPVTYYHMNCFTNNLLTLPGRLEGLINYFEYNDDMSYNIDYMEEMKNTYGFFTYNDLKDYFTEEVFYALPMKYAKVAIGKGMITFEEFIALINDHLRYMS